MCLRLPTGQLQPALIVVWVLFVATVSAVPAQGQFSRVWSAEELQLGQQTNLFVEWEGQSALDGVFVELPTGWTLQEAMALRRGYERVRLRIRRMERGGNLYVVSASRLMQGAHHFVLHVQTGGAEGPTNWAVIPFVRRDNNGHIRLIPREAYRVTRPAQQVPPMRTVTNRVLAFRGDGPPWLLRRAALPDLGTRAAFTVEFWMRTTDLNEVILSTWNGEDRAAYPLELMVDATGRLRYYRGQAGQHVSMATEKPVADGQWHHVALTHNPDAGWTRLFLDGLAADSLYTPVPPALVPRSAVALGGRVPVRAEGARQTVGGYTGLLDELRIWARVRPPAEIRRTMRQPLETSGDGVALLHFEAPIPEVLVEQRAARTERVVSDLAFYYPVRNVQAVAEGTTVALTWETRDPHTTSFVIERSTGDGVFEPVGEVRGPADAAQPSSTAGGLFRFDDANVEGPVVFYRIRQRFQDAGERLSGTIKLGLGREEEGAVLVGNFPNPFNPNTTIVYEVRQPQRVRISVWDLSGQLVTVLVDRGHQPGNFEVDFEGSDLPSGTYFVRLQSKYGPMLTHKMILMK